MSSAAARARTAVTMTVLAVVLVVMLVVGWRSATAAFPSLGGSSGATKQAACTNQKVTKRILRTQVTVSVYNGTTRKGFAGTVMDILERRGFKVGSLGNAATTAPGGVQVLTLVKDDPRATLVAAQFNPKATIRVVETVQGPGVNVILGKGAGRPASGSPAALKLAKPVVTCLDKTSGQ